MSKKRPAKFLRFIAAIRLIPCDVRSFDVEGIIWVTQLVESGEGVLIRDNVRTVFVMTDSPLFTNLTYGAEMQPSTILPKGDEVLSDRELEDSNEFFSLCERVVKRYEQQRT